MLAPAQDGHGGSRRGSAGRGGAGLPGAWGAQGLWAAPMALLVMRAAAPGALRPGLERRVAG